jgi:hypothetical protein
MTISEGKSGAGWPGPGSVGASGSGRPTAHDTATRMLAFSRARAQAFASHGMLINEVAWELLLGLFVAQERGRRLTVQRLCGDVALPAAVAVRWVRALRAHGLVGYDDQDGQAAGVRLTPAAETALRALIDG